MLPKRLKIEDYKSVDVALFVHRESELLKNDAFLENMKLAQEDDGNEENRRIALQTIADHSLILPGHWSAFRHELDTIFAHHHVNLDEDNVQEFDVGRAIFSAVAEGLGVTIQQPLAIDKDLMHRLKRISLKNIIPEWKTHIVWDPLFVTPPATELIMKVCGIEAEYFGE